MFSKTQLRSVTLKCFADFWQVFTFFRYLTLIMCVKLYYSHLRRTPRICRTRASCVACQAPSPPCCTRLHSHSPVQLLDTAPTSLASQSGRQVVRNMSLIILSSLLKKSDQSFFLVLWLLGQKLNKISFPTND